ncbi:trypsin-like peptidase domain-containing protein [Thermomonas sp.]|uniref:trypsin-like peptidase domain-containing protein n=1 Tax=Thermomonas sp. TaxID=1971895 RepID=UPI001ED2C863|nr:trypsin-like peptidase domain-containing protein [Thermomonas sp.]MBK6416003.1 trypsin-like peptidase domain-containing protein [Thermomonas sp.]HRA02866.1 trypsin-like peptidase domain-containing protein [Thermomonas sp.]
MKTATRTLLALTAAAAFGGFAATGMQLMLQRPAAAEPAPAAAAAPAIAALPAAVNGTPMPSLAPMLKRVLPAVVSVNTKQRVRVNTPFGDDPVFRRMFGIPQERIAQSLGSGVIVDAARGLVLTNNHVVEDADEVSVTLADGRTLKAEFVGNDADTDIALMRIPAQELTAIPVANSDRLQIGDFVVAVGNPFGVGQTVTSGIVSAIGRNNLPGAGFQNFIQTDASINPGNSGGALVNLNGELVGINTASFNPRGSMAGNIGLGFAIPSNLASNIKDQLLVGGVVRRGTLGIDTQDVDARIAAALGLAQPRGAVVTRVYPGSAGAAAGLKPGDVILAANGEPIADAEALRNFQGLQPANARVALDVRRDGQPLQLTTGLREVPKALAGAQLDARLAGASFADLPESLRRQGLAGVLVEQVERDSRAARSGLRKGDVVLAASSGDFTDLGGFRAGFAAPPPQLVLRVLRGRSSGQLQMR